MLLVFSRSILPRKQAKTNKIHRNSAIYSHPDVSKSSIHRKPRFSSNPDVFHINFPRFYLSSLAAYSRASRSHNNFPRIYLPALAVYSRASKPHQVDFNPLSSERMRALYSTRRRVFCSILRSRSLPPPRFITYGPIYTQISLSL